MKTCTGDSVLLPSDVIDCTMLPIQTFSGKCLKPYDLKIANWSAVCLSKNSNFLIIYDEIDVA